MYVDHLTSNMKINSIVNFCCWNQLQNILSGIGNGRNGYFFYFLKTIRKSTV